MEFTISKQLNVDDKDLKVIEDAYSRYTASQIGEESRQEIAFFVKDAEGKVLAGVKGSYSNYGWLWVDLLFVSESLRGMGYGTKLMKLIESEARDNGCEHAYLNSFSFQAASFYQQIGYKVYGELKDFPKGHSVFSMTKSLID